MGQTIYYLTVLLVPLPESVFPSLYPNPCSRYPNTGFRVTVTAVTLEEQWFPSSGTVVSLLSSQTVVPYCLAKQWFLTGSQTVVSL